MTNIVQPTINQVHNELMLLIVIHTCSLGLLWLMHTSAPENSAYRRVIYIVNTTESQQKTMRVTHIVWTSVNMTQFMRIGFLYTSHVQVKNSNEPWPQHSL